MEELLVKEYDLKKALEGSEKEYAEERDSLKKA